MRLAVSKRMFRSAVKYMVGGVNSPVRSFKSVGGNPLFIAQGKGSRVVDVDGNAYVDYVMSWGALILGHAHQSVTMAVCGALKTGTSFGAPTAQEVEFSRMLCKAIPSVERVRLVNSGTEAVMSAIRVSRGYTGKNKIIKFEGCYHGHYDGLLVKAGSGAATLGIPDSAGVPSGLSRETIVCPYNDIDAVYTVVRKYHNEIACIIVEPVAANMGVVEPHGNFLSGLRELSDRYGIVLIFDEVICGFRFCYGGVQKLFGITPDMTCLGKIIGGGLPIGAYGGKKEIMEYVAPVGPVYQAGTLAGNPLAVSAGIAVLRELQKKDYSALAVQTAFVCSGLGNIFRKYGIPHTINNKGSLFTLFFYPGEINNYSAAGKSDTKVFSEYFWAMLKEGVYLPPSQFEAQFFSFSHSPRDIQKTLAAHEKAAWTLAHSSS